MVDGTHRPARHGSEADAKATAQREAHDFGQLKLPAYLKGAARDAWKRYIEPAHWLDASREPSAVAFCELYQEMRRAPASFPASKHTQLRGYMADLGLTDTRQRQVAPKIERDEFFD
ncbi:hypothetical protein QA649_19665 [Bradyrhizobium sp. CB1717]|uniref:hypothetical protein n=1 Tax=Bradyrhizobium sp. CB1717 TaxID=3039154 RepID=UPI0024B22806|nr:hypothetical protein [Bradyrhizobium sp. CB1717]WFU28349.1 hypothetical protein QA649_19665 [Bradyrhizobium sp. CB1717]